MKAVIRSKAPLRVTASSEIAKRLQSPAKERSYKQVKISATCTSLLINPLPLGEVGRAKMTPRQNSFAPLSPGTLGFTTQDTKSVATLSNKEFKWDFFNLNQNSHAVIM